MRKTLIAFAAVATFTGIVAGGASATTYEVQPGDSLWSISQDQGSSVGHIQTLNELTSELILPGQKLVVSENKESEKYTVVEGDTLWGISVAYGTTVGDIVQLNQLKSDLIHPGDTLIVQKGAGSNNSAKAQPDSTLNSNPQEEVSTQPKAEATQAKAEATQPPAETSVKGKELTVSATAYTASCEGCSGVTATGQDLRANPDQKVIAVDPTIIPLGSKVEVEGYGVAIAGDVGGAIKGNKIDIFIPSKSDAINYGVQTVKIKVLN
ncbi:LysM peptidoglycan-binding and 3D domain-containing protein [Bacillus sp. FSL K6-3431]|uniref:LysM peptidoglycan-binding and 3D domain-containing protein n=1 Tax=Bacillus sp. FSL K6-3431 TaxID=2921500 RepID=UPI0030FA1EA6